MVLLVDIDEKSLTKTTEAKCQKEPFMWVPAYDTLERSWCKNSSHCEDHTGKSNKEYGHQKVDPLQLSNGDKSNGGQYGATEGNQASSDLHWK